MKKIILSGLMAIALILTVLPAASAAGFADGYGDVKGTWYEDAADSYAYPDIFADDSGQLHAGREITRIEFVRLLHKALGISINYFAMPDVADSFDDMTNDDVGAGELIDLVTAGIVEPGGSFSPEAPLERDVMIHWTVAALDYMTGGDYAMIMIMPAPFDDDSDITPAYKNDVVKSVVLGLIKGRGDNMLYPRDGATRAEALTVTYRLTSLIKTLSDSVEVNASAAVSGENLLMTLTIRNNTAEDVTIHHTSGQHYDFKIFDSAGNSLYTWSAGKLFILNTEDTVIAPGETVTYSDVLEGDSFDAIKDSASLLKAFITGTSDDFVINTDGYDAVIR